MDNRPIKLAALLLGTALFATHSYADAVQVLTPLGDSVLQIHELAYSWAASLVQTNNYGEATALLNKLEQQPLSTETLMLVAQLWSQMANYEHTVQVCRRALQLVPKLPRAHYTAGLSLLRLNRSALRQATGPMHDQTPFTVSRAQRASSRSTTTNVLVIELTARP